MLEGKECQNPRKTFYNVLSTNHHTGIVEDGEQLPTICLEGHKLPKKSTICILINDCEDFKPSKKTIKEELKRIAIKSIKDRRF